MKLLLIFIGGGAGSVMRYLLCLFSNGMWSLGGFPVGTFLCNVLGCFLIGLFNSLASTMGWSGDLRLMLTVGLCGGFTTFSTFSNEGMALLNQGNYIMYAIYVLASIVFGVLAVLLGMDIVASKC